MESKTLRGDRNQCQGCKEYFNSTFAFDKHRTGEFGKNRRCRTTAEMRAIGMDLNAAGFWIGERMSQKGVLSRRETPRSAQNDEAIPKQGYDQKIAEITDAEG